MGFGLQRSVSAPQILAQPGTYASLHENLQPTSGRGRLFLVRHVLLAALLLLAPMRAFAGGAFACMDACSRDPRNGMSCDDLNMGCNPITRLCVICSNDSHCAPGGTCVNNQCLGVVCIYDAGADAGDTGTVAEDASAIDAEAMDAEMDAAAEDAEPIDVAFRDARTDLFGGGNTMDKEPFEEDDCGCTTTSSEEGSALWILIALAAVKARRKRVRGTDRDLEDL